MYTHICPVETLNSGIYSNLSGDPRQSDTGSRQLWTLGRTFQLTRVFPFLSRCNRWLALGVQGILSLCFLKIVLHSYATTSGQTDFGKTNLDLNCDIIPLSRKFSRNYFLLNEVPVAEIHWLRGLIASIYHGLLSFILKITR